MLLIIATKMFLQLQQRQVNRVQINGNQISVTTTERSKEGPAARSVEVRSAAVRRINAERRGMVAIVQAVMEEEIGHATHRRRHREAVTISPAAPLQGQTAPDPDGGAEIAPVGRRRRKISAKTRRREGRQSPQRQQASQTEFLKCTE